MPPGSPIALQGLVGALAALIFARALAAFDHLTVARLQARSVLLKVAVWCSRVAVGADRLAASLLRGVVGAASADAWQGLYALRPIRGEP